MRRLGIAVTILMMASVGWGQQGTTSTSICAYRWSDGAWEPIKDSCTTAQPAPLKCGKYQHEITPRGVHNCRLVQVDGRTSNLIECDNDPPVCAARASAPSAAEKRVR